MKKNSGSAKYGFVLEDENSPMDYSAYELDPPRIPENELDPPCIPENELDPPRTPVNECARSTAHSRE